MTPVAPSSAWRGHVHAVTGTVPAKELGRCYAHAHLLGGPTECPAVDASFADLHLDSVSRAVEEARSLRSAGAGAIVEMSCLDFNRSLTSLRDIAVKAQLVIVATTGFRRGATWRASGWARSWEATAERLERDVLEGESGITCGVIKAGSGRGGLSDDDCSVLRAAAQAQQRTGAPISTHTEHGELALDQLSILESSGADIGRVALGHVDLERDRDVLRAVLERGASVIFDQIGKEKYGDVDYYADLFRFIDAHGFVDRLLVSSDFGRRSYLSAYGGKPGLAYLLRDFPTQLAARGVGIEILERAMVDNPAKFFACAREGCGRMSESEEA